MFLNNIDVITNDGVLAYRPLMHSILVCWWQLRAMLQF